MKHLTILGRGLSAVAFVTGGVLGGAACSSSSGASVDAGQDVAVSEAGHDAGHDAVATADAHADGAVDAFVGDAVADGAADGGAGDAVADGADGGTVRHLLVTYDGTNPTTMFAVNLATGAIDGTFTTTDTQAITDTTNAVALFFLNQTEDLIDRLDPTTWKANGSWSVAAPDAAAGSNTNPYAMTVATETQVYAIRQQSNVIDVFDITNAADAGKPTGAIDLSALVQANDADGNLEATAAVYVAASKRLYVLLGNINTYAYDAKYGDLLCSDTVSSVVAIDTTTNTLVSLSGTAPGGGVALTGWDPTGFVYDAAKARLLVFNAGCNPSPTVDGGAPGAIHRRGIDAVDLTAFTSSTLIDLSTKSFPGSFAYIDATHAIVGFQYPTETYLWDPTTSTLGASLPNAPQTFAYDGNGNLVGASVLPATTDGGASTTDIQSMSIATGTVTTLKANAITVGEGYIGSVGVWPAP